MKAGLAGGGDESSVENWWETLAASRLGKTVGGRLTLERVLGIGGTATVYAARHRNGRALAVKVLHPEYAHHPAIRERFLAEGYAANKVEHAHAVAVLDEGEDDEGNVFIVMELLHGSTMLTRLNSSGLLPTVEVVAMALSVLEILAQAHDRGVVHRDVKPSNIFETDEGVIKLLDFGIARVQDGQAFATRPGTTLGTPAFMSPELAAGKLDQLDALTDLWALGATMFQLLSNETVHESENDHQLIVLAATVPARSLAGLRPDLDPELTRVIDRALAFERPERWPDARSMMAALRAAARHAGLKSVPPMRSPMLELHRTAQELTIPASGRRRLGRSMGWGLLVLLGIGAAGFVFALYRRSQPEVPTQSDGQRVTPVAAPRATAEPNELSPNPNSEPAPLAPDSEPAALPVKPALRPAQAKKRGAEPASKPAEAAPSPPANAKNPLFFPGQ